MNERRREPGARAHRGWLVLGLLLSAAPARAADHRDGPSASKDPATDIGDLYAFSDRTKVYLALTVYPGATREARFATTALYAFHAQSRQTFAAAPANPIDILCAFDPAPAAPDSQRVSCWVGADTANYVSGVAQNPGGLRSQNGKVRVFTGLRRDPFAFNQDGFARFTERLRGLAGALTFDAGNCPALTPAQAKELRDALAQDAAGEAPRDAYLSAGVLALVLEIDKALLTKGGPIVSVWASTRPRGK